MEIAARVCAPRELTFFLSAYVEMIHSAPAYFIDLRRISFFFNVSIICPRAVLVKQLSKIDKCTLTSLFFINCSYTMQFKIVEKKEYTQS